MGAPIRTRRAGETLIRWTAPLCLLAGTGSELSGQEAPRAAIVDTIIISRSNVFTAEEAASSGIFRVMNAIHVTTSERVVREYLQFQVGEPFDSASVAESERQLRLKKLFREVSVDSVRLDDGRLAVRVVTRDGWSLKPKFKYSVTTTGDWTGTFGVNEINLLGTGNQVYAAYVKEVDRDGLNATADFDRMLGSQVDLLFNYAGLSDGKNGNWIVGRPFRNTESPGSYEWDGLWADQDILRYRVRDVQDSVALDTTTYRREAFTSNLNAALAARRETGNYLRFGATVGVRQEAFSLSQQAAEMAEDSVYGTVGAFAEISRVRFQQYRRFNGFGTEDIDLSSAARLTATLAPDAFGWQGTGVGLAVQASAGQTALNGRGWAWSSIEGNYQWGGVARDSGRIVFNVAAGYKPAERHSTAVQLQVGRLWNQRPGDEFDLGFENAPRGWPAHAFVGNRMWWTTIEHRYYAVDQFLNLVGIGFGAFLDYGGAWYDGQGARTGGSVGLGLRLGSALSTVAMTGRADIAYNIGGNTEGSRWTFAFGSGFAFPRRTIPTINYRAQAPP